LATSTAVMAGSGCIACLRTYFRRDLLLRERRLVAGLMF
jgi:hypothetical protein